MRYIGELLYTTAITYFFEMDSFEDVFAKSYKVANVKQVSEGMVSKDLSVSYSFGIPIKALEGGMIIDVDRYIHSPVSKVGDATKTQQFMLPLGQMSSGMEHGIFEQLYNKTGTSAVKALSVANSQGIPIYTVNASNIANVLPVLQISDQVKTDIQNAGERGVKPSRGKGGHGERGVTGKGGSRGKGGHGERGVTGKGGSGERGVKPSNFI